MQRLHGEPPCAHAHGLCTRAGSEGDWSRVMGDDGGVAFVKMRAVRVFYPSRLSESFLVASRPGPGPHQRSRPLTPPSTRPQSVLSESSIRVVYPRLPSESSTRVFYPSRLSDSFWVASRRGPGPHPRSRPFRVPGLSHARHARGGTGQPPGSVLPASCGNPAGLQQPGRAKARLGPGPVYSG